MKVLKSYAGEILESLYKKYHSSRYIHPDPLELLKGYNSSGDREIVGIIASSLALGRVQNILTAVKSILDKLPSPRKTLLSLELEDLKKIFINFKYRFYTGMQLADFLFGIKCCLNKYGSLNRCFLSGMKSSDKNVMPALDPFVKEIAGKNGENHARPGILPLPDNGSACKRLNLFLRWMVRQDEVDPGGWEGISTDKLIVPVDTHMLKVGRILGFTSRHQPDAEAAFEITESLKSYDPVDPVRYDFSITRPGIHPDLSYEELAGAIKRS